LGVLFSDMANPKSWVQVRGGAEKAVQ